MKSKVIIRQLFCLSTVLLCSSLIDVVNSSQFGGLPILAQSTNSTQQQTSTALEEEQSVNIGVMAIRGVEKTLAKWQPTLDYLNEEIPGYQFHLIPLSFDSMEETIADGQLDFVLPNPGMYVELEWVYGARRIATLKNLRLGQSYTEFGAVIFRRSDRQDLETLEDLKGKRFMAVSEIALLTHVLCLRISLSLHV